MIYNTSLIHAIQLLHSFESLSDLHLVRESNLEMKVNTNTTLLVFLYTCSIFWYSNVLDIIVYIL